MSTSFEYADNHIVASIDGKQCLIDTGSPNSLGEGVIKIEDKDFTFKGKSIMGTNLESIAKHIGTHLDALIGGDVLSVIGGLFVWIDKMEIHFDNPMGRDEGTVELFNNIPIIPITIRGRAVRAYIDTGAKQSYIDSAIAEGLPNEGESTDFYPTLGSFTAPLVSVRYVEPGREGETTLKFAILPNALSGLLSMTGCKAILGIDFLKNNGKKHFQINYRNKLFTNY
jgi:hypothetical protein